VTRSPGTTTLRALTVWLVIVAAESVHGTLRRLLLEPMVGDLPARQISVFTGAVIIFVIAWMFARWLRLPSRPAALAVGGLWVALTLVFEIVLGRMLGLSWSRIWSDFDLVHGGLMPLGLLAMALTPLAVHRLRETAPQRRERM
jgi:hypothetical protein